MKTSRKRPGAPSDDDAADQVFHAGVGYRAHDGSVERATPPKIVTTTGSAASGGAADFRADETEIDSVERAGQGRRRIRNDEGSHRILKLLYPRNCSLSSLIFRRKAQAP